ncbi:MnuA family membrane nuclease [Mycoplasmopsis felifaucium]|uniref:Membrane nuclease MnuA n=1 Tax=Mycoplasmopsis felifaucium TaxID=35768 RepID=A0ABZ2RP45_9BACT|nr:hypothetical protein [Mycoplasmopsis felifaucium]
MNIWKKWKKLGIITSSVLFSSALAFSSASCEKTKENKTNNDANTNNNTSVDITINSNHNISENNTVNSSEGTLNDQLIARESLKYKVPLAYELSEKNNLFIVDLNKKEELFSSLDYVVNNSSGTFRIQNNKITSNGKNKLDIIGLSINEEVLPLLTTHVTKGETGNITIRSDRATGKSKGIFVEKNEIDGKVSYSIYWRIVLANKQKLGNREFILTISEDSVDYKTNGPKIKTDTENNSGGKTNSKPQELTSNNLIRVGFWNVKNLGDNSPVLKYEALASVIYKNNYNLIGLVEIDGENSVKKIVDLLNSLTNDNTYSFIQTNDKVKAKSNKVGNNVAEYASFIYNSKLLKSLPFDSGENVLVYDNSNFDDYGYGKLLKSSEYMRPPVGAKFETVGPIKNNFTYVISHFDSPGVTSNETKHPITKKSQGAQEVVEGLNLKNVMNWFDDKDGNNDDLIFAGDTNIKSGNANISFNPVLQSYTSLIDDNKDNATSLSSTKMNYSEPYDKMFVKTDLKYSPASIYDMFSFAKGDFAFGQINSFDAWKNLVENAGKSFASEVGYINFISDHTTLWFDIELNENDKF